MRRLFRWIPLPGLLVVGYLVIAFIDDGAFQRGIASVTLPSNRLWTIDVHDALIAVSLFLLYIEIFKSTRATRAEIVEHALAFLVFVASLLIFLLVPGAGTTLFCIVVLVCALDVIAGYTVTLSTARRSIEIERG
jgi:hypothetical protein